MGAFEVRPAVLFREGAFCNRVPLARKVWRKDPVEGEGASVASVASTSNVAPAEGDGAPVASVARTSDAAVLGPS